MLLLISEGFGFNRLPHRPLYDAIAAQFRHRPWGGIVFYDLIMPAFLFMVGVAMPYSLGRRLEQGADRRRLLRHVAKRSAVLIVTSWIVFSIETSNLHLQFHNVLTQVAATSLICFFIMQWRLPCQVLAAVLLLAVHSALYLIFPGPDGPFQQVSNVGAVIDRFLMGHNYRAAPCVNLNTVCEVVNVLSGIWVGNLLRSGRPLRDKFRWMAAGAVGAFALGLLISPIVPVNKWLWTASYTLITVGWSILGLFGFLLVTDVLNARRPLLVLSVVGMNSLFVYCIGEILRGWLEHAVSVVFLGFRFAGELAPVAEACGVLAAIWYMSWWLYQRRIFLRP